MCDRAGTGSTRGTSTRPARASASADPRRCPSRPVPPRPSPTAPTGSRACPRSSPGSSPSSS
ncbi:hypothetical protein DZF95_14935 [Clavibacter michiganensis]|nr:hypothetical protein DZF95_14935 [Clavibacter michiganensis]